MIPGALQKATSYDHHRFHFLDALRGIAAIVVIMRHAPLILAHRFVTYSSFLAVDFFFCLSGFVIAFSYEKRLVKSMTLATFTLARIIRLYPLAILGTLIGTIQIACVPVPGGIRYDSLAHSTFPLDVMLGFAMLPHIAFAHGILPLFPMDGVIWTLFFEFLGNIGYAFLVRKGWSGKGVLLAIAGISLIALLVMSRSTGTIDSGWASWNAGFGAARVGLSFCIGVLTFRAFSAAKTKHIHGQWSLLVSATVIVTLLIALCSSSTLLRSPITQLLMISIVFPVIIYIAAKAVPSVAVTGPYSVLGVISYPLYILHVPLLAPLFQAYTLRSVGAHAGMASSVMLLYTVALIVLSWAAARFYDEPVRRFLTEKVRKSASAQQNRLGESPIPAEARGV